jgi:hypothetical protein
VANGIRKLDDWLTAYADYTSETESPSLFHFWVGVSVIASTLERKCLLHRGHYTLFPNLYIILVGASARVRKSTAIGIGGRMLSETFGETIPMISQKITLEAFTSLMSVHFKNRGTSATVIVSDEFGVFLGQGPDSAKLMGLLTKLYDCPDVFDYHTIARGKELGHKACCNMLAGTTPIWLRDSMPPHAVGGGFTSRIIFVYQDKPEKLVAFPEMTAEMLVLKTKLMYDLKVIGNMKGEYKLTAEAKDWYINWYTKVFKPESMPHASLDGYFGRKHDTLLKVAMCLAASKSGKMEVGELELMMALKAMNTNERYLPDTLRLIQMTDVGEEMDKVYRMLCRKEEVDFTTMSRQVSYCMGSKRLEEVLADLIAGDRIVSYVKNGKRWFKKKE